MINVAHFRSYFLNPTETFIYQYLVNFKRIRPYVLTLNTINQDQFPFPEVHNAMYRPRIWGDFVSKTGRHLLGRNFKVESLIRRFDIALIHAHFGHEGYYLLPVKKRTGMPLITTFYGFDMSILPRQEEWRRNYRELFEHGDIFLVEGSHMKRELVRIGCPEEKIRLQHIAVDPADIPVRKRLPKGPDEKVVILFCGSFVEKKGLLFALEGITKVVKQFDSVEFRVIGDGELRQEVETYVKKVSLSKWVKLLGMKSHRQVIEELYKADIFLHPSVTASNGDSEGGAPTIIIEAQAAGLPIVSTLHADIPEVVVDGKSGFLVKERDATAIADRLEYLLSHQMLWAEMGKAGREHVEMHYNITREVEKLEDIYFSLVEGKR